MSTLIFNRGRCERLERGYVHSSTHPLSLEAQPQPTEITGCFMLSFSLLRLRLETFQHQWVRRYTHVP